MTSFASILALTFVALAMTVHGCDEQGMGRCVEEFKAVVAKYMSSENKVKKYPKICKALIEYIVCGTPTVANCTQANVAKFKDIKKKFTEKPYECFKTVTNEATSMQGVTTLAVVSTVLTTFISRQFH